MIAPALKATPLCTPQARIAGSAWEGFGAVWAVTLNSQLSTLNSPLKWLANFEFGGIIRTDYEKGRGFMNNLEKKERNRRLMAEGNVGSVIMKMAIPTIIAFLINSIYSLADTYFVNGLKDINATAAISVNGSLDQLIMMCGSMLAVGANSYIARLLGEGNEKKASQVLATGFYIAFGIGLALLIFGSIFIEELMYLLGANDDCLGYSVDYATYVLIAALFMATSFVMNQCLRSEGSATLSMVGMGFGGVLNVLLDYLMVPGCEALGIPAMGVLGASLATAISKVVSFGILLFPYVTGKSILSLKLKNFRPTKDILGQIVTVGSSSLFRNALAVVAAILLNKMAGNINNSVLAAMGVTTKIMMFPFSIILGFGTGFQPVAGFNWGAKQYDRVEKSFRFAAVTAILGSIAICAIIIIFAKFFVGDVMGIVDPVAFEICVLSLQLQCISLPAHAWVAIVNMLCAGLGNAKGALALATSRQGTCFLPILFPMALIWGQYGIASVQAAADILSLALAIPIAIYMSKKIRKAKEEQLS